MKNGILWLLIAAFLASVVFLFLANSQKNAALVSLNESKQQAQDLQAQLDQVKSSNADSQNAQISQLRADNQDLPRLRNQVTMLLASNQKLQSANDKLTQQLKAILSTAQDQQTQLEKFVAEKQQVRAVEQELDISARNVCINNLRQIDAAKNQWALENNKTADAIPAAQDLLPYLKDGIFPVCPSGGTYTIGAVGVPPTCSVFGHALPPPQ
jgi:septal ring factor EnvC (AmiA/AmiB activator)